MEQGTGVEPASAAWEAAVLPMYEPCRFSLFDVSGGYYSRPLCKMQQKFLPGMNVPAAA